MTQDINKMDKNRGQELIDIEQRDEHKHLFEKMNKLQGGNLKLLFF